MYHNLSVYEDEEDQLREVPELDDNIKQLHKIVPKKNKKRKKMKLTIKGECSSSSDDERFERYNFAQKVQNTQYRDHHNELVSMFF